MSISTEEQSIGGARRLKVEISTEEQSIGGARRLKVEISTEEQSIGGARRRHAKFGMCASLLTAHINVGMPNLAWCRLSTPDRLLVHGAR